MRSEAEVAKVLALVKEGESDLAIARTTGIPRRTVWQWRQGRVPNWAARLCSVCAGAPQELPAAAYSYLLGMYLGDGCISTLGRTYSMRLALDAAYPTIISSSAAALEAVKPGKHAWVGRVRGSGCVVVAMYWNHWPCLFPQHGPGKKHLRPIVLQRWQQQIVASERQALVRGLIHSDGCRVVANDRGVASVRYHFSNLSEDIKAIYCESLDALGVHWTRPCSKQIAVYRKEDTRFLDTFVGPKR